MPKRTETLSRAEIARAALVMVDRDGVDRFSMRRLATELGSTTMAVYHYFENKAEILQAAADQVWIEIIVALPTVDDPFEEIVQGFLAARRAFHRHPDVTPYAFASPTTEAAAHVAALGIADRFERAGFTGEEVGDAYFVLATFTFGASLLHAERTMLDRRIRQPVSDLAEHMPEPLPDRAGGSYAPVRAAMGSDPDLERFERGLRSVLAGLVARSGGSSPEGSTAEG
jgi:AcrR family transcriptional regulator